MILFAKVDGKKILEYPVTFEELRNRFPTTIFPDDPKDENLLHLGYARVFDSEKPRGKPGFRVRENDTPVRSGKVLKKRWELVELTQEEIDFFWKKQKEHRNLLLIKSNWTQLLDTPKDISEKWRPYRAAIKEAFKSAKYPWEIKWPEPPKDIE